MLPKIDPIVAPIAAPAGPPRNVPMNAPTDAPPAIPTTPPTMDAPLFIMHFLSFSLNKAEDILFLAPKRLYKSTPISAHIIAAGIIYVVFELMLLTKVFFPKAPALFTTVPTPYEVPAAQAGLILAMLSAIYLPMLTRILFEEVIALSIAAAPSLTPSPAEAEIASAVPWIVRLKPSEDCRIV